MKNITSVNQIIKILKKISGQSKQNPDWIYIKAIVRLCMETNKPLTLISFTCSRINPKYLNSQKRPELYISLNPKGNNLEEDLPVLNNFYQDISQVYPVKIIILIGNTDPFYIYTQEGKILPNISTKELWKRYNKRWKIYKNNLNKYLLKNYPKLNFELISWYQLEQDWQKRGWDFQKLFSKTLKNINKLFPPQDLQYEVDKFKKAFGPSKYFYNLDPQPVPTLKQWTKRKFAEYAVQGLWIKQIFPDAILLQNEKPSDLRTRMYQPLIQEIMNTNLPVIYPYGVDNFGFQ